ncbi:MAG: outer membrane lipoprotein-sorting protein [Candidatus Tectomicrobia bacterium]|uniref:Outer membrane lipoprotein-sorting protein n=1 Tax=Tectimicrobiota bacterium TaxID=2528274 RepID=A0A932GNL0_UNCTE|nr:outer membrane lipoprotein-sorting protein [Candidatus Tectomicrobia bacterium]
MKKAVWLWIAGIMLVAWSALPARAQAPSADEIMRRSYLAMYYQGEDMRARIFMRLISREGHERIRELTMTRRNLQLGGEQRYFLYFHRPPDVRDMALLVWAYLGRDDDRWLYVPALKLVRRIAASDKHTSFVGSDFSYEDVSGREPEEDTHKLLREEKIGERDAYVVESIPKDPAREDFSRKLSWIDRTTWLPLKVEHSDRRGDRARVFTAEETENVQGFWTITKRLMKNAQSGHWTEVVFKNVRYNLKLSPDLFSERALRAPPAELVR